MHGSRHHRLRWAVLVGAAGATAACRPEPASAPRIEAHFEALWWSPAQMEGLDPNAPPPKTTRVRLERWEYSDPVGVPHPDTVDLVVHVATDTPGSATRFRVTGTIQWRVGPQGDESKAEWRSAQPLPEREVRVEGGRATLTVPVDVAGQMRTLRSGGAWPWALRIDLALWPEGWGKTPVTKRVELPIRPAD